MKLNFFKEILSYRKNFNGVKERRRRAGMHDSGIFNGEDLYKKMK